MSSRRLALLAAIFALAARPVCAQGLDIVVKGVVTDQTGGVLRGVALTFTHLSLGLVRTALTDVSGRYQVASLPPGVYDAVATHVKFRPLRKSGLVLHAGDTLVLDLQLELPPTIASAEVVARPAPLLTSENTLARLIRREEIDGLPVVDRNFNALASLAPGVTATGVYTGVDIGGSQDWQNSHNVDGASSEGPARGEQRVAYSQEWIQEFQVLTSQFHAEFGRASGGIVNVMTRSGSDLLSARFYGFFRNESWDARPVFADVKTPLRSTRLGATVGGPLKRARVFAFAGFEWLDDATTRVVNTSFPSWNGSVPAETAQTLYLVKLDGQTTERDSWRVRYNADGSRSSNLGVGGIRTQENGHGARATAHEVVGTWNRVLSSSMFNELRTAVTATTRQTSCNFAQHHPPGTWFQQLYPGAALGCPPGFGRTGFVEWQLLENLSWSRGTHRVKAGVVISRGSSDGDYRNAREGSYTFDRDELFDLAEPDSYPTGFSINEGGTRWEYSRWAWGLFVQDSWHLTPDVTVNAGVRYDLDGSYTALNPLVRVDKGLSLTRKDANNLAPRIGAVWTPFDNARRTRLRGGAGLFYDENHAALAQLLLVNSILSDRSVRLSATSAAFNPFWPDVPRLRRFLAEALARHRTPDLAQLPAEISGTPDLDRRLQIPYTVQFSAGILHDFGNTANAGADVLVSLGRDQYVIRDVNIAAIESGRIVRLNPNFGAINQYGNGGSFTYRALLLHAGLSPVEGQLFRVSYTFARNESNTRAALDGAGRENSLRATNPFSDDEDFGPADNDVRHTLSANWVSSLPWELQFAGIVTARSGLPWSVATEQLDGDPFLDRPEPRNSRRGDGFLSVDMRLMKTLRVRTGSMSALIELFNVTNAANLTGYISRRGVQRFGEPTAAAEGRRVQLGLRFGF